MRQRCSNPKAAGYADYGGRGITVCPEWQASFVSFRDWANANGLRDDLEIDRIDTDGNYEPSNCRWVTRQQNCMNRRKYRNNKSGFKGVSVSGRKWEAQIMARGIAEYLGAFATPEDAARAYDKASLRLHGEFGIRNFPETKTEESR
jgi:hypothetical protein